MKRVPIPKAAPNYALDTLTGDIRVRPRERLLDRLPPTASRNAAFDLLHERLAVATEFFQHHGDGGRYGVYRAMADLIDYLTSRGIPRATLRPLEAVMAAIVDADDNVASAIFALAKTEGGGRPRKPVMQTAFEGQVAIVMECCVQHCRAQKMRPYIAPAAELAAMLIRESTWPTAITAKQLIEIRERIQQAPASSPDRREVEIMMDSDVAKARPLDWAKTLLAHQWVNPPPKLSA